MDKGARDGNILLWRAVLQLAQVTDAVFECEIPESEGLPENRLPILRLLGWQWRKTTEAIAIFLGISADEASGIIEALLARNVIRRDAEDPQTLEHHAVGTQVARRIAETQRERIQQTLAHLPSYQSELLTKSVHELAYGLVSGSTGFGITCAGCWAHDTPECTSKDIHSHCVFCIARYADFNDVNTTSLTSGPKYVPLEVQAPQVR